MKCPICDVVMAPALEHPYDGPIFLCSCQQIEHIVTSEQLDDWVQQSMALQFVGRKPIEMFGKGALQPHEQVDVTLAAIAVGLKVLFR